MIASAPISVCIPTYNRGPMLAAAIDSALPQLQDGDELVIVDNHSTDNTQELLQSYADPRVRVVRNDVTVNIFVNHNRCVEQARHDWVLFLHSDDQLADGAMAVLRKYLRERPGAACYFPAQEIHRPYIGGQPMVFSGFDGMTRLMRWVASAPTGAMFARPWLLKTPFPTLNIAGDLMLLGQLLGAGGTILLIPEQTIHIGRGAFQTGHRWVLSGENIRDTAEVFKIMLRERGVVEALGASMPQWTDEEIARCLKFLAHADERATIRYLQTQLHGHRRYKRLWDYHHVRIYRCLGPVGLRTVFHWVKILKGHAT